MPRWWARYASGPAKPMTKSRSGAAQARKPAAMRRGSERGGESLGALARASSAPESACVSVSTRSCRPVAQPGLGVPHFGKIAHREAAVRGDHIDELVGLLSIGLAV